jgi:quercetin dioxygenase-like cupin family protein
MNPKEKNKVVHGNIRSLGSRCIGSLKMRTIDVANTLNVTVLHESLPLNSSAPDVVHSHTCELVYITKGKAFGYLDNRRISLREGDYLFIPAKVKHRFETRGSKVEAVSIFSPVIDALHPDAKIILKD